MNDLQNILQHGTQNTATPEQVTAAAERHAAASAALDFSPRPDTRAEVEAQLVAAFAPAMQAKLAHAREKGRGGWERPEECSITHLYDCLLEHVRKPNLDMVDVGNLAAMIWHRQQHVPGDREALSAYVHPQDEECHFFWMGEEDEIYAARSEQEARDYYRELTGEDCGDKIGPVSPELLLRDEDGTEKTLREWTAQFSLPMQVASSYT